ncbi:type I-E CRISPR-associated protein Cse1/CasA [candidate division KSB1 bacterium]|nr:type I-E CRISPR-associated protein Cse1/CasA [candidate division KSB1 bacterium]
MNSFFNLVDEDWIPCIVNGRRKELSLKEALIRSHNIREIHDSSPLVSISLFKLLLTLIYRIFSFEYRKDWEENWEILWEKRKFNQKKIDEYFRNWKHRFFLFDQERPFYQYPKNNFEKLQKKSVSRLAIDFSSGQNPTLFDHTTDDLMLELKPSEAARLLISQQSYALQEGRGYSNGPLSKGIIVLAVGDNLFETLLLNYCHPDFDRNLAGSPIWEKEELSDPSLNKKRLYPENYMEYLTWQSRKILLIPKKNNHDVCISEIYYLAGFFINGDWKKDPLKSYKKNDKGKFDAKLDENRAIWRDSHGMFEISNPSRPESFTLLSHMINKGALEKERLYNLNIFGICAVNAKVFFWRHERLPLPLSLLTEEKFVRRLKGALKSAEKVGEILRASVSILADELKLGKDEKQKLRKKISIDRQYWSELAIQFKSFVIKLAENEEAAVQEWIASVRSNAVISFKNKMDNLGTTARILKAVNSPKVTGYFYGAMKKELEGFEILSS